MDGLNSVNMVSIQPSQLNSGGIGNNMQVGDQVNAQVVGGNNGSFTLNINGQTITAESQVPLNPGETLQLQFQGLNGDGVMSLQLLTINRALAFSPMSLDDLMAQLVAMKMPMNETVMTLAQSMAEFGIPLTKENMMQLMQALNGQEPNDANMQAASFLQSAGLPMTSENLATLTSFFQSKPELGSYLGQLQNFAYSSGNTGQLGQLLAMLPGLLGEYLLEPNKNSKKDGTDRIGQLAGFAGLKKKGDAPDPLSELLSDLKKEIEDSPEQQKGSLEALSTTLTQIDELLNGEHLLNADTRPDGFVYFQIPVDFGGQQQTAQVRIQYEKDETGKRSVDPQKTKLEFAVTTPNMMTIHCDLDILRKNIVARMFVEESREGFIESHLSWLKESIEKLNYKLASVNLATDPHEFWPIPKVEWKSMEKVNVKV